MKLSLVTAVLCIVGLSVPSFSYSAFEIRFVTKVPKSCKHLGDVRAQFDGRAFYQVIKSYKAWNANRLFTKELRRKARAIGANRLVVVDLFHGGTEYHHDLGKSWERILSTEVRARAFRCKS